MSDVDLDALLVHRDFVRALARSLLLDRAQADDAEQDTWLAALRSGPVEAGSARAWLAAVVRNFARKRARGALRRRTREDAVAAREPTASTESLVAREQVRRQIVTAVLDLDEPFRSAVIFRYFEEQPPREIARRTGVSVNTVRSRLRLAHEKLRKRLDREHGGDRSAWAAPLLALLPGPTGVLLMSAKTKTLLAATAVLLLAGLAAWRLSAPAAGPPAPSDSGAPPALADTVPSGKESGAGAAAVDAALEPGRITGRVPDGAGDREVRIVLVGPDGATRETKGVAFAEFAFDDVAPTGPYVLRAEAEGMASTREPGLRVRPGATLRVYLRDLSPPATLAVVVRTVDGAPIPDAAVSLVGFGSGRRWRFDPGAGPRPAASRTATTGPDGRVTIEGLPVGYRGLLVEKDGFARGVRAVRLYRGETRGEIEVRLESACALSGRVLDSAGAVVPGAVVEAVPEEAISSGSRPSIVLELLAHRTAADDRGRFSFRDLPAGVAIVKAIDPGRAESRGVAVRLPGADRIDLVVEEKPRGTVEGTVTDADTGDPIPDVRVQFGSIHDETGGDGRYRLEHVPAGSRELVVSPETYVAPSPPPRVEVPAGGRVVADLRLSRGARVVGRVTDPDGAVAGARVQATPVGVPAGRNTLRARSDAEGRYALTGFAGGRYLVRAFANGLYLPGDAQDMFHPQTADPRNCVAPEPGTEVNHDIALAPTVALEGRVVDEAGAPLPGVDLELDVLSGAGYSRAALTDGRGAFRLEGVNPERGATLRLAKRGYASHAQRIHVEMPAGGDAVVLTMRALPRVTGVVRSGTGAPLPGARVVIAAYDGPRGSRFDASYLTPVETFAGEGGRYVAFPPAPDGLFEVRATAPGHSYGVSARVPIEAGKTEYEVDLALAPTCDVTGRVVIAGTDRPVPGARVRAEWGGRTDVPSGPIGAVTDDGGRFRISGLRAGDVRVGAEAEGYARAEPRSVTLPGADGVRIELAPARPIAGRVVDADGAPVADAKVAALPFGSPRNIVKPWSDRTAADGSFRIEGLTPGDYRLEITGTEIAPTDVERVTAGDEAVRITVERGKPIAGRVVDPAGKGIAGTKVTAWPTKRYMDLDRVKTVTADADGAFRIPGLAPDLYRIQVSAPVTEMTADYGYLQKEGVPAGTEDLVLVLERTLRIRGTVRDADGRPVEAGILEASRADGRADDGGGAGMWPGGRFEVGGLSEGRYRFAYRTADASEGMLVVSGGEAEAGADDVEVVLGPGESLTGRVEDERGDPVAGARVGVTPPGSRDDRVTQSRADGTFRIRGLAPGSVWRLWANVDGGRHFSKDDVRAGTAGIRVVLR